MLKKISFKNYKSFKEWQEVELRPITVLIGKNNSGKSAVSKLLTVLSGSLSGTFEQPLKLENKGVRAGLSNIELVYNKIASLMEVKLETSEEKKMEVAVEIDRDGDADILQWVLNGQQMMDPQETQFKGFIPIGKEIPDFELDFDYIGPYRKLPEASYTRSFDQYDTIGIDGTNAYPILIQDSLGENKLLSQVSQWYEINFEGWKIDVSKIRASVPAFELVLSNKVIDQINIVNVGQGINQTLPLVVRSFMKDTKPTCIIMEEPETHLHPAAHGVLAERFADSYLQDNNKRYVIETHSQNFVLRLRRLIAENKLSKEDVGLYYVEFDADSSKSSMKQIKIDDKGGVEYWPEGIFQETSLETRAIRNAQSKDLY